MKKLICILLATILVLGLCACGNIDSVGFLAGTWSCEADPEEGILASELVLNEDFTGTLKNGENVYNVVWKVNPTNPDSLLMTTVGEHVSTEDNYPVLKADMLITKGKMLLNMYDGDGRDDFKVVLLLEREP